MFEIYLVILQLLQHAISPIKMYCFSNIDLVASPYYSYWKYFQLNTHIGKNVAVTLEVLSVKRPYCINNGIILEIIPIKRHYSANNGITLEIIPIKRQYCTKTGVILKIISINAKYVHYRFLKTAII